MFVKHRQPVSHVLDPESQCKAEYREYVGFSRLVQGTLNPKPGIHGDM